MLTERLPSVVDVGHNHGSVATPSALAQLLLLLPTEEEEEEKEEGQP